VREVDRVANLLAQPTTAMLWAWPGSGRPCARSWGPFRRRTDHARLTMATAEPCRCQRSPDAFRDAPHSCRNLLERVA
jgi:hypothetical protein